MTEPRSYLESLLGNLRALREKAKLSPKELEERLILGPGWITRFENGATVPSIDMLLAILRETGSHLEDLLADLPPAPEAAEVERFIFAEPLENDLIIRFRYANFDASYVLKGASIDEFEVVIKTLRDGLARLTGADAKIAEAIKTNAVAKAFLKAVEVWPTANPSDLWWFLIYRGYCDPFNHPAQFARMDFTQSWKRAAGWALEEVLVRHYGPYLVKKGIKLFIADSATKQNIIKGVKTRQRLEADKIDVVLTGGKKDTFFGVVHVKASFAERRTDDVPMSIALSRAGYTSPLWTMDCKSVPSDSPTNRGELGEVGQRRSAKRLDIEKEGYFTGCFSYNRNTHPSSDKLRAERRVYVCDFSNPDDEFSRFIVRRWLAFGRSA